MTATNQFAVEILHANEEGIASLVEHVNGMKGYRAFANDDRVFLSPITLDLADVIGEYMNDLIDGDSDDIDLAVSIVLLDDDTDTFKPLPEKYASALREEMSHDDNNYTTADISSLAEFIEDSDIFDTGETPSGETKKEEKRSAKRERKERKREKKSSVFGRKSKKQEEPEPESEPKEEKPEEKPKTFAEAMGATQPSEPEPKSEEKVEPTNSDDSDDLIADIFGDDPEPQTETKNTDDSAKDFVPVDTPQPETETEPEPTPVQQPVEQVASSADLFAPDTTDAKQEESTASVPTFPTETTEEWAKKADELLKKQNVFPGLPQFDDRTQSVMQPEFLSAEQARTAEYNKLVEDVRAEMVARYQERYTYAQAEAEKNAKGPHDEAIEKIKSDRDDLIAEDEKALRADYKQAKNEFVKARIPDLERQFDDAHSAKLNIDIDASKKSRNEEVEKAIAQEDKDYAAYFKESVDDFAEEEAQDIDVSDYVARYTQFCQEQITELEQKAQEVQIEFEQKQTELQREYDEVKAERDRIQHELDERARLGEQQIDAGVQTQIAALRSNDSKAIRSLNEQMLELTNKLNDSQRENAKLRDKAARDADKLPDALEKLTTMQAENRELKDRLAISRQLVPEPTQQQPTAQTAGKQSNLWKFIAIGVAVLAVIVIGFMALGGGNSNSSSSQATSKSASSSSDNKATSGTSSSGKISVQLKNGQVVDVTKTGDNTGYYTDNSGNKQNITFSNN